MKRKRERDGLLLVCVWVVLAVLMGAWVAVLNEAPEGKPPDSEVVSHKLEKDLRTGELLNVEIVKCRLCDQVISYIRCNGHGKVVDSQLHPGHHCNRAFVRNRWTGLAFEKGFNLFHFLDTWQKRFSVALGLGRGKR